MQASKPQRQPVRRARGSLTEDAIVETAFAVAADSSIEELSIPLIAKSLDVGVTSIYWHVRNKSELLDAMTDRALRRSGLPAFVESGDWRASLMAHARGVRQTFLGDPVLTDLILIRGALSPLAQRLGEQETQKAIANMIDAVSMSRQLRTRTRQYRNSSGGQYFSQGWRRSTAQHRKTESAGRGRIHQRPGTAGRSSVRTSSDISARRRRAPTLRLSLRSSRGLRP